MAVSTVFTLIVLPCLLRLGEARAEARQLSALPQPAEEEALVMFSLTRRLMMASLIGVAFATPGAFALASH